MRLVVGKTKFKRLVLILLIVVWKGRTFESIHTLTFISDATLLSNEDSIPEKPSDHLQIVLAGWAKRHRTIAVQ